MSRKPMLGDTVFIRSNEIDFDGVICNVKSNTGEFAMIVWSILYVPKDALPKTVHYCSRHKIENLKLDAKGHWRLPDDSMDLRVKEDMGSKLIGER